MCEHGLIGACAECDGCGMIPETCGHGLLSGDCAICDEPPSMTDYHEEHDRAGFLKDDEVTQ